MPASFPGVFVEEIRPPRPIEGVPTSVTAFIGRATIGPRDLDTKDSPTRIAGWPEYERIFGGLAGDCPMGHAVRLFFVNGGREALIVRVGRKNAAAIGDADISAPKLEARKRGLWALERAADVNLLCIPPLAPGPGGDIGAATRRAAAAYCLRRRALFIADPPARWSSPLDPVGADGIDSASFGLASDANTALFFPRLRIADPARAGGTLDVTPSGAVAGVIARSDTMRGMWKAPAGLDATLNGVIEPATKINDRDNELLNPRAVNCLRQFPGKGSVVWGARTLAGAAEWKYVNVRRLAFYIEASVERGTRWAVFEPNDESLWAQLRLDVGAFLLALFRSGAFQGATAKDAFYLRCDRNTMNQDDLDDGRLNVEIGFAPLKPAEFIVLRVSHRMKKKAGRR